MFAVRSQHLSASILKPHKSNTGRFYDNCKSDRPTRPYTFENQGLCRTPTHARAVIHCNCEGLSDQVKKTGANTERSMPLPFLALLFGIEPRRKTYLVSPEENPRAPVT